MANSYSSDSEPTTRTLLRQVLDTADSCTPRRRRSARISAQRALLETPSPRTWSSQTKATARQRSRGARSTGRLVHGQASGHLEEQTPRTLLKNILLTAQESSIVMPERMTKPAPASQVAQPSRRESSRGSLELQLPELEPPQALAPVLLASGRRKQRVRLSVFQQEVDRGPLGLPLSQEPPGNPDASSLTSSLNLTFATPLQPQSVRRPGLARRPPTRRTVDVGALLQDLQDNSLASVPLGDSLRTPVATLPTDTVLEDTQPFSQPLVGHSLSVYQSLPCPHPGPKDTERAVHHRTKNNMPELQNHMSEADFATPSLPFLETQPRLYAPPAITETERSQRAVEPEKPEGSSGDEDISERPASPESVSNIPEFLQAKQLDQFLEPAPSPDVAVLSSEPPEPVLARVPSKPQSAGPRPRQDPHKAGLTYYTKLFSFYTKMPMERKALETVEKCLDKYLEHLCNDLEVFAAHAGRKTVKPEDLELLMRRQGLVTDQVSLHLLVERHLPLEYRQLLIPCAFSGNSVFPAQ
ncbi:centromere protein T isoform X2 [Fukomys damarensis]|uniref:Centromere protein T n=1 Tax=Fukomys damarensis TaxID=885580 RepID=A0A091DAY6_FUKDA|nr:centromere protein T isoform X2 [Fukomys damarensis]KFO20001.1 Centromere protein T [Fukomys damarensis]